MHVYDCMCESGCVSLHLRIPFTAGDQGTYWSSVTVSYNSYHS